MYSTLAELKSTIQIAKQRFTKAIEQWLKQEKDLNTDEKQQWIAALNAKDRDTMMRMLVSTTLPLRIAINTEVFKPLEKQVCKSEYCVSGEVLTPTFNKLAVLTTLVDHLHQLEEHLKPLPDIDHNALQMSQAIIKGIALRWPYVGKPSEEVVSRYTKKLAKAQSLFQSAKEEENKQLDYLSAQIEVQITQFQYLIQSSADLLISAYALQPDHRSLSFLRTTYTPWQNLLRQLAADLFADVTVMSNKDSREVAVSDIMDFYKEQNDLTDSNEQHQKLCETVEGELQQMQAKISLMAEVVNPQKSLEKAQEIAIGDSRFILHTKHAVYIPKAETTNANNEHITTFKEIQLI